ncbi:methyltransferase [Kozakia baliensis]|uniref:class I SAM-dependent methyltransferase n=1 Tax=Kozakia baliensis TaxID=153496 RepID=UPI00345B56BF
MKRIATILCGSVAALTLNIAHAQKAATQPTPQPASPSKAAIPQTSPQAAPSPAVAAIQAALANPDRPAADTARDAQRHASELLAFAGIKQGDYVADLMPGSGYFTRIFSNIVGPNGHVYGVVPVELLARYPKMADSPKALSINPAFANTSAVITPIIDFSVDKPLDVVWTSQNYHDVYGTLGADSAQRMDRAIFQALKPGGTFIVIDHVASPANASTAPTTLHRIDPALIIKEVQDAGFTLEAQSDVLRNPADNHTLKVFDPAIRGQTDQVVLKFRKPAPKKSA